MIEEVILYSECGRRRASKGLGSLRRSRDKPRLVPGATEARGQSRYDVRGRYCAEAVPCGRLKCCLFGAQETASDLQVSHPVEWVDEKENQGREISGPVGEPAGTRGACDGGGDRAPPARGGGQVQLTAAAFLWTVFVMSSR